MKYTSLPKWNILKKDEKERLKEILTDQEDSELIGEDDLGEKDLEKINKQILDKKISKASTDLTIPNAKFIDYRMPIWGNSYTWSWVRPYAQAQYLVIHHTVTKHEATPDDIALLHKARGWGGIGYHFVITKDGTIYYVGDLSTARANVANMNEKVIGITLVGDFTKHLPSDTQIMSAHTLCDFLIHNCPALTNITSWDNLVGHKDLQATACPGTSWPNDMKNRVVNNLPYTPQDTKPEKDYQTLYNQLKEEFNQYQEKNEDKIALYEWAALNMNTNMEGFKNSLSELVRCDSLALSMFKKGLPVLGKKEGELQYPDNVDVWEKEIGLIAKELAQYREIKLLLNSSDDSIIKTITFLKGQSQTGEKLFIELAKKLDKTGVIFPKDIDLLMFELERQLKEDSPDNYIKVSTVIEKLLDWITHVFSKKK